MPGEAREFVVVLRVDIPTGEMLVDHRPNGGKWYTGPGWYNMTEPRKEVQHD